MPAREKWSSRKKKRSTAALCSSEPKKEKRRQRKNYGRRMASAYIPKVKSEPWCTKHRRPADRLKPRKKEKSAKESVTVHWAPRLYAAALGRPRHTC